MATRKTTKKKTTKKSSSKKPKTVAAKARPSARKARAAPSIPGAPKGPTLPKGCSCGSDCHDEHAHLPGYLLVALGALAAPINFGMIPMLEWAKAWPLLLVLFGFVYIVKTSLCRKNK
jgi:hypothetical protein